MNLLKYICLILLLTLSQEVLAQDCFLGEIKMFGGNFAPRNWALCEGQILGISNNQSLFSILGTTYGGDGRTSFGLPDLRGRSAVGAGTGPGLSNIRLGRKGGQDSILNTNYLPNHSHTEYIKVADGKGDTFESNDDYISQHSSIEYQQYAEKTNAKFDSNAQVLGVVTNATGTTQNIPIRDPYLGVNYIICITGTFPPRN